MKVKVIAREVQYAGRGRLRGEVFDAEDRWARGRLLLKQVEEVKDKPYRRADFAAPKALEPVAPPPVAPPPVAPAPVVEAPAAETVDVSAEASVADKADAPRRTYRHRRLEAE